MCAFQAERICLHLIMENSLEWFESFKILMMTWAVEEHCLEVNVILIQKMSFRLYGGASIKQT